MDVLLIIDVQQGLFSGTRYRQELVLANINLTAPRITEHHHWMWCHLSLPEGRSVTLLTTDELLAVTPALQPC